MHEDSNILIIDDDEYLQRAWAKVLKNYNLSQAFNYMDGIRLFREFEPDMVLLDVVLPDGSGLDLLAELKNTNPNIPIVVMTGRFDMTVAAQAVKGGAYDFLSKPINMEKLKVTIKRALDASALANEVTRLRLESTLGESLGLSSFVVNSKAMQDVMAKMSTVSAMQTTVLLLGPSGVGKSRLARMLHQMSNRKDKPFIEVNLTTINEGVLESQLFGHMKGAFTGATRENAGFFASADTGTIFLDEIGEIPRNIQVKLLQVIQDRMFYPVGSTKPVEIDVRIVAATVQDLRKLVSEGSFREDLFYRLNVFPIHVPPLAERRMDIPALVQYFVSRICRREGLPPKSLASNFLDIIMSYDWPGNVRELENALEYAITVSKDRPELRERDLSGFRIIKDENTTKENQGFIDPSDHIPEISGNFNLDAYMDGLYTKIISYVLARENGNLTKTSAALGITRRRLSLLMNRLNIDVVTAKGRPRTFD
ncbi:sigma-54 dependent transcriptional regulator [Myxococcota bacterium]|nr:sigma-54 dependent transcriptional regulator [Myxococcota bacterium]MBU1382106.1 sigma-54 dependent transcriptional regulator [Myxococcota bacterium]MBU1498108.1 sigma-54 dependent transcriptional regulator [Myxococcota bacterium]